MTREHDRNERFEFDRRTFLRTTSVAVAGTALAGVSAAQDATVSPGESIQQAINDANPGDEVLVEDGTYEENLVVDTADLTLRGESRSGVVIDASGESGRGIQAAVAGLTLESFTLIGTDDQSAGYGIKIEPGGDDVAISDVTVEDSARTGIDLHGLSGGSVEDVLVTGTASGNGLALTDCHDVDIDGAVTTGNGWGGLALYTSTFVAQPGTSGVTVENAEFSDEPLGVYLQDSGGVGDGAFTDITVEGNDFRRNGVQVAELSQANDIKDDVDWLPVADVLTENDFDRAATVRENPIVVPAIFSSVQDAVDVASPGQTVVVEPGAYDEDVAVDVEDLSLVGPNAGTPGDGARGDEATVEGRVVLSGDGTVLDGFDVSPPPAERNQESEAVRISNVPEDVTVENNVVRDFERDDPDGGFYGVDGINIFGGDANDPIEDAIVRRNLVRNLRNEDQAGAAGISVQGNVVGAAVEDNVVTEVAEEVTAFGFGVVIRGTGNHDEVPADVEVAGNSLTGVESDPASAFDGVGFEVEADGVDYRATGNTLANNDLGVEVKVAADETVVDFNDIVDNGRRGVLNTDDATLDATDNWWGHASGPGGPDGRTNPAGRAVGKGDAIEGDVAFDPWLRRSIDHPSR